MIEKRLLKDIPESNIYVQKQVTYQWFALVINIIITLILSYLLTLLIGHKLNIHFLIMMVCFLFLLLVFRAILLKKSIQCSTQGSSLVKKKLRSKIFEHILSLSSSYQDSVSTAELLQLSVEGINQLETYFGLYLPQFFYSLLAPVTLFIIIAPMDIIVAFVLFICVPLIPISIVLVQKFAKKLLSKYWTSYTTLGDSFLENLQGLTTLKIYGSDDYKHKEMNDNAENFRKITMRVLIMQLNSISVMDIVAYGGAALGCYFTLNHYNQGSIALFHALFIILMSFEFFIPLRQLGSFFHIAMNGIAASSKIFRILDLPSIERTDKLENDFSSLQVKDLYFAYEDNQNVLNDIHMDISKNEWIGIVGESGSGKSTIAKLIMGYHSHYSGNILINNKERKNINDESLFSLFSYIHHDPMIFKGTLRDNVDFKHEYSDESIWNALKQVGIDEFFKQQNGLNTLLLESGSNLSGGQKQRINLARALLKDTQVYIFDEATSAVDVESEQKILEVIHQLSKHKSVIYITHRLSTVKECNYLYVFEDGYIKEHGKPDQLYKQKGIYYHMSEKQKELEEYQNEI